MAKAVAPVSLEKVFKLQHFRQVLQLFYDRREAEQGVPAELVKYVCPTGVSSAPEDLQLFENILATAQARASTWNGQVVFVYLPRDGEPGL